MDTTKTVDLTRLYMQINNTVVFSDHTHIQLIKNPKQNHVNSKPKVHQVYGVTTCYLSHGFGLWTFIVEQSLSVNRFFA